jgi:hypothetical protein
LRAVEGVHRLTSSDTLATVVGWRRGLTVRRRLLHAAAWLTTPLLPDDYLGLVNPLWSRRELRGRVEDVRPETASTASLTIRPGIGWTGHRAGQHVRVGVDIRGVRHWRPFSLSSSPHRTDGCLTITVKATPDGLVSPYLVRHATPGTIVRLTPAEGDFVLPEPLPDRLLFLTAGSGITPVAAMLRSLAAAGFLSSSRHPRWEVDPPRRTRQTLDRRRASRAAPLRAQVRPTGDRKVASAPPAAPWPTTTAAPPPPQAGR